MAAVKKTAAAKGKRPPKKGLHTRMPTKRSINLVLIDENRISPLKAIPAILIIIILAAAFSKFMVADRLLEMSRAQGEADRMKTTLQQTQEALENYEGIEDTYAHMTTTGMTEEELGRVNRVSILELVSSILPQGDYTRAWSVSGNILTVEITGRTLEYLNELSRRIEKSPIVDTCAISTAVKNEQVQHAPNAVAQTLVDALDSSRRQVENGLEDFVLSSMINTLQPVVSERIQARLTIYLVKPPEDAADQSAEAPQEGAPTEPRAPQRPVKGALAPAADEAATQPEEVSAP